jgi:hypothetical protein
LHIRSRWLLSLRFGNHDERESWAGKAGTADQGPPGIGTGATGHLDYDASALTAAIGAFIDAHNDRCQPLTWTKDDKLIAKIKPSKKLTSRDSRERRRKRHGAQYCHRVITCCYIQWQVGTAAMR